MLAKFAGYGLTVLTLKWTGVPTLKWSSNWELARASSVINILVPQFDLAALTPEHLPQQKPGR